MKEVYEKDKKDEESLLAEDVVKKKEELEESLEEQLKQLIKVYDACTKVVLQVDRELLKEDNKTNNKGASKMELSEDEKEKIKGQDKEAR